MAFRRCEQEELGITPIVFDNTFYCVTCGGMASKASKKTCPRDESQHVNLSGTRVRTMLREGQTPPPQYSRPEVARVLIESMAGVRG